MGEQRRLNYALQPMTKEAFIQRRHRRSARSPAYFTYDAVLNSQESAPRSTKRSRAR